VNPATSSDDLVKRVEEEYDFFDPRYRGTDEIELVGKIRDQCPAVKSKRTKQWEFFTDELVRAASEQPALFTSYWEIPEDERDPDIATTGSDASLIPVQSDAPEHTWYRKALNPLFTLEKMNAMEAELRQFAGELLDPLAKQREFDYHQEFATPFPGRTFCRLMGWPIADWDKLMWWRDIYMYFSSPAMADRLNIPEKDREPSGRARQAVVGELTAKAAADMRDYLATLFEQRRNDPQDDVMTALLHLEVDNGRKLTEAERMGMGFNFFLAGLDTVSATLSLVTQTFAENPDDRHRFIDLMDDDLKVGLAINELTRFHAIVRTQRQVQETCEFHGIELKKNDLINFDVASACRDEQKFENADSLEFDRDPNPHLGFGHGRHRCLGIHLGRLELKVALQEFHRRMPNYRVPEGQTPERGPGITRGLFTLPIEIL
jgi:cytochrome P450